VLPSEVRDDTAFLAIAAERERRSRPVPEKIEPTGADWDLAIKRFQFFRRLEKPGALPRARHLPRVLCDVANEIYDIANELERTNKLEADLAKYSASEIAEHIAFHGWAFEVRHRFVPLEFLDDLPERLVEGVREDE